MKKYIALILVLAALALTACQLQPASGGETSDTAQTAPVTSGDEPVITVDMSVFDYEFMKFIESTTEDSYMISPLSFRYALGMLLLGARGTTLKELQDGLGVTSTEDFESYIRYFNSFADNFNDKVRSDKEAYDRLSDGEKEYHNVPAGVIRVADSVWKRDDLPEFLQSFTDGLGLYGAEHRDFNERNVIPEVNKWVNEKTEGMIPRLLQDGYDVTDLAVILMNALYFKDGWANAFSSAGRRPFYCSDGTETEKEFIGSREGYGYYKDGDTELVAVTMNNGVEMVFVLGGADGLEEKLGKAERQEVEVIIPKFELETSLDDKELLNFLKKCGVSEAFDQEKADFSGMFDPSKERVWVDDIIQKTKIKLDETGVEAAAVTAIMMKDEAAVEIKEPVRFVADRPFRFFIRTASDKNGGSVTLFEGRLVK